MRYWVYLNEKVVGPYEEDKLATLNGFSPDTLICTEQVEAGGNQEWVKASSVFEFDAPVQTPQTPITQPAPAPAASAAETQPASEQQLSTTQILLNKIDQLSQEIAGMRGKIDETVAANAAAQASVHEQINSLQQQVAAQAQKQTNVLPPEEHLSDEGPIPDTANLVEHAEHMVAQAHTTATNKPLDFLNEANIPAAQGTSTEKAGEEVVLSSALDSLYNGNIKEQTEKEKESTFQDLLSPIKTAAAAATVAGAAAAVSSASDTSHQETETSQAPITGAQREEIINEITAPAQSEEDILLQTLDETEKTQTAQEPIDFEGLNLDNETQEKLSISSANEENQTADSVQNAVSEATSPNPSDVVDSNAGLQAMDSDVDVEEASTEKSQTVKELVPGKKIEAEQEDDQLISQADLDEAFTERRRIGVDIPLPDELAASAPKPAQETQEPIPTVDTLENKDKTPAETETPAPAEGVEELIPNNESVSTEENLSQEAPAQEPVAVEPETSTEQPAEQETPVPAEEVAGLLTAQEVAVQEEPATQEDSLQEETQDVTSNQVPVQEQELQTAPEIQDQEELAQETQQEQPTEEETPAEETSTETAQENTSESTAENITEETAENTSEPAPETETETVETPEVPETGSDAALPDGQVYNPKEMTEVQLKEGSTYLISDFIPPAMAGDMTPEKATEMALAATATLSKPKEEEAEEIVPGSEPVEFENPTEDITMSKVSLENTIKTKRGATMDIRTAPMVKEPADSDRLDLSDSDLDINAQHDLKAADYAGTNSKLTKIILGSLVSIVCLAVIYVMMAYLNLLPASFNLFKSEETPVPQPFQEQAINEMLPQTNTPDSSLPAADDTAAATTENNGTNMETLLMQVKNQILSNGQTLEQLVNTRHAAQVSSIEWSIADAVEPDNYSVLIKVPPANPQSFKISYRFNYNALTKELEPTISDSKNLLDSLQTQAAK